jgi:hypothetical protein
MRTFVKSEFEETVKGFDYSDKLAEGDYITSSSWEVDNGLTGSGAVYDNTVTELELSGGTSGNQYKVTNKVRTAGSEAFQKSFYILVRDR